MQFIAKAVLAALGAIAPLAAQSSEDPLKDGLAAYENRDYPAALAALAPLAQRGNAEAQVRLGLMHHNGWGVPVNFSQAAKWYRLAAAQNNPQAQYELGKSAADCKGFSSDNPEMLKLLRRSAEQGYRDAQEVLGHLYAYGVGGVSEDLVQAYLWYDLAAARGGKGDAEKRDLIARKLSADQIADARRLAQAWTPKIGADARD